MELVTILEDVAIPNMPKFRKGQEVKVSDAIGDILITRGHAKPSRGKSVVEVKKEKTEKSKLNKKD